MKESWVQNAYRIAVPRPTSICNCPGSMRLATRLLRRMFAGHEAGRRGRAALLDELFGQLALGASTELELETAFRARALQTGFLKTVVPLLNSRARLIADQVGQFVSCGTILDLGCGDSLASGMLADLGTIVLADVMDYRDASQIHREFHLVIDGAPLPFEDGTFDTVLALTLFHHATAPLSLLKEAIRVCRGRIIVIESVFGVRQSAPIQPLPRQRSRLLRQPGFRTYIRLRRKEQLAYCSFVDWFYNRLLHENVNVPYNYNTPAGWRRLFEAHGLRESAFFHLGLDQPIVPEFHTLHVLEVIERRPSRRGGTDVVTERHAAR